jgi:hypothetical protein
MFKFRVATITIVLSFFVPTSASAAQITIQPFYMAPPTESGGGASGAIIESPLYDPCSGTSISYSCAPHWIFK